MAMALSQNGLSQNGLSQNGVMLYFCCGVNFALPQESVQKFRSWIEKIASEQRGRLEEKEEEEDEEKDEEEKEEEEQEREGEEERAS